MKNAKWFKSKVGVDFTQSHRNDAFCAHTILDHKLMVVEDLRLDERFTDNPFVKHGPHVRFYAGAPLLTPDGQAVGTRCVVDIKPRRLTADQVAALRSLANLVGTQLELRRVSHELAETSADLKTLGELLPLCSYCKGVRDDQGYWKQVEAYIESHTGARMSHGLCPTCATKHFPNYKLDGARKATKV